jgi:hypothetical protein
MVYGPERSGTYGGAQGIGGLDAVVTESNGATTGQVNNFFGDVLGTLSSAGSVTWFSTTLGGYGPMPARTGTGIFSVVILRL